MTFLTEREYFRRASYLLQMAFGEATGLQVYGSTKNSLHDQQHDITLQ